MIVEFKAKSTKAVVDTKYVAAIYTAYVNGIPEVRLVIPGSETLHIPVKNDKEVNYYVKLFRHAKKQDYEKAII